MSEARASAESIFAALAAELGREPDVQQGTGFGSMPGLRTGRKIFAMLQDGDLVVKLPAARCAELIDAGSGRPFQIGARRMREWVRVSRVDEREWLALSREARDFVG